MKSNMFRLLLKDKFFIVRMGSFIAFVFTMLMTPNLWFSERGFPKIPIFNFLSFNNYPTDVLLIVFFVFFYVWFVVKPNWKIGVGVIFLYIFWVLSDQNKLQPYFFEMIFVVFALSIFDKNDKQLEQCLMLLFIGTYFWSGMHKFNVNFFELWLNGLGKRIPFVPYPLRVAFTYAVPFLEAFFGISLLFMKTRKIGAVLLVIMHLMILSTLFLGGYGYELLPLTSFNMFVLLYVIYNSKLKINNFFNYKSKKYITLVFLVIVLPLGNLFGISDHWLSFSYYTGKPKKCRLYFIDKKQSEQLPKVINQYIREYEGMYYIELNEWGGNELEVGVYPEKRVYMKVKAHVDSFLTVPSDRLEYY